MFFYTPNHRTPKVHLTVRPKEGESKDLSQLLSDRFQSLTLTDNRGFEADQLDIVLSDHDGKLALPSRGAILSLAFGWSDQPLVFKGEYTVDEIEHSGSPDILTLRARSADIRGSLMTQHERSFHQKTIGDIVQQIASENKLTPQVSPEFAQTQIAHIDQANESSISFLQRLAEEYDAIATVKNGNLLFMPTGTGKSASGQLLPKIVITRQDGDSHRFSIAEGENYTAVRAYWHTTTTGKRGEVAVNENGKQSKGISTDSENIKTLRHSYQSKQAAENACKREFGKLQRGVATFSLNLAVGNAELMPELPVEVKGFKAEIDSTEWIITQVTHSISADGGFTSAIECELKTEEDKEAE